MIDTNHNQKSTYSDDDPSSLAGKPVGVMKGVMETPSATPAPLPGQQSGGKHGNGKRVRNPEAKKAARIARCGLTLGSCGKVAEQARRSVGVFRKVLEQSVLQVRGVISIPDVLSINTAARWELHAQMATAFMRRDEEKLSATERLAHSSAIANAATQRDKAVDRLRLPGSSAEAAGETLKDFYAGLAKQIEQQPTESPGLIEPIKEPAPARQETF